MKTKLFTSRKRNIIFLLILLFSSSIYSQQLSKREEQQKRDELINSSDYILHVCGKSVVGYIHDDKGSVSEVIIYNVKNVLRGPDGLKKNDILVIQKSRYRYWDGKKYRIISDVDPSIELPIEYGADANAVIFCKKADIQKQNNLAKESINWKIPKNLFVCETTDYHGVGVSLRTFYFSKEKQKTIMLEHYGLFGMDFIDFYDCFNFLSQYKDVTIPVGSNIRPEKKSTPKKRSTTPEEEGESENEKKQEYDKWVWRNNTDKVGRKSLLKSTETVEVSLKAKDQHIDLIDDQFYFEFDVIAKFNSTTNGLYMDKTLFNLSYNSTIFGENINANTNIECTLNEEIFDPADYEVASNDHWVYSDQVSIDFAPKLKGTYPNTYYKRIPINLNQEYKLYTVRIKFPLEDAYGFSNINKAVGLEQSWNTLDMVITTWSTTADQSFDDFIDIDDHTFEINKSYMLGAPTINSVESIESGPLSGGTGCQVIVTGYDFLTFEYLDNSYESPGVYLKSSNETGYIKIDYFDINSWTDNEIIFTIPSWSRGNGAFANQFTGSGNIMVNNRAGGYKQSEHSIDIKFSVFNTHEGEEYDDITRSYGFCGKQIPYWARRDCSEQLKFKLSDNVVDITGVTVDDLICEVTEAFKAWNKVIGYDFLVWSRDAFGEIERTATDESINDDENVIMFYNPTSTAIGSVPAEVIFLDHDFLQSCDDSYARKEIDFKLNPARLESSMTDNLLYTVVKHELGHGLGLAHVNNKSDLMYYQALSSLYEVNEITSDAELGVKYLFEESATKSWSCTTGPNVETIFSASTCISTSPGVIEARAITSTKVVISWESVSLADSYQLERDTDPDFGSANFTIFSIDNPTVIYTDSEVSANTTYYYRIKAINTNGESSYTTYQTVTTPAPSAPKRAPISVSAGNNSSTVIEVNWEDAVEDETNYIIERIEVTDLKTEGEFEIIGIVDANSTSFYDYNIEEGKTYEYRIMYITSDGYSEYSASVTATAGIDPEYEIVLPISRDALLNYDSHPSYSYTASTNYETATTLQAYRWTHSGYPMYKRSLLDFDLSEIPEGAIIESAILDLYGIYHITNLTTGNSGYKSNASWLEIVTEDWDASTVTWNTQPATSSLDRVELENSETSTQDYSVDITSLIQTMNDMPESTYGLMFRLQNDIAYTKMVFGSSDNADLSLQPVLRIKYKVEPVYTTTIYPNKDAEIQTRVGNENIANTYMGDNFKFRAEAWTTSGNLYTIRSLINFDLSSIPSSATITNAKINLFSPDPQESWEVHANAQTMGSSAYKSNACYLQRITSEWDESSVTWNTQPTTTTTNQVSLIESSSLSQDYKDIDITSLVSDLHDSTNSYGLMMRLQNEIKYTRMCFASSDFSNYTCRPYIEISYKVLPSLKSGSLSFDEINGVDHKNVSIEREFIDSLSISYSNFEVYPNPTTEVANISLFNAESNMKKITIYNSNGIKIDEIIIDELSLKTYQLNVSQYSKGVYQIEVLDNSNKKYTETLVIK